MICYDLGFRIQGTFLYVISPWYVVKKGLGFKVQYLVRVGYCFDIGPCRKRLVGKGRLCSDGVYQSGSQAQPVEKCENPNTKLLSLNTKLEGLGFRAWCKYIKLAATLYAKPYKPYTLIPVQFHPQAHAATRSFRDPFNIHRRLTSIVPGIPLL